MKNILDKQTLALEQIAEFNKKDRLLQLSQLALQYKTDRDVIKEKEENDERLDTMNEILREGLVEQTGGGANSNIIALKMQVTQLADTLLGVFQGTMEDKIERERLAKQQAELLEKIEKNTKPGQTTGSKGSGVLGIFGSGLAIALGALAGVIQGHVKYIASLTKLMYRGLVKLSDFFPSLKKILFNIELNLDFAGQKIKSVFKTIGSVFDDVVSSVRKFFTISNSSATGKFINVIRTGFNSFFEPIQDAFSTMKKVSAPIAYLVTKVKAGVTAIFDFFSMLGNKITLFSTLFTATKNFFSAIIPPLRVIMTVWDTLSGAIEGFKKEGIIGGIKGAITGFMNGLIFGLADLVKDGISWLLGAIGFENAEKTLDSFSFQDLFKKFIDAIFSPVETIKKMFEGVLNFLSNLQIPAIGFSFLGKQFGFGPWTPFKSLGSSSSTSSTSSTDVSTTTNTSSMQTGGSSSTSNIVSNTSALERNSNRVSNSIYNQSAVNSETQMNNMSKSSAPVIVNAPTNVDNSSKQNIAIPAPVRNEDSGYNRYISNRAVFV